MPIYTYSCTDAHEHDEIRPINQREIVTQCPECGKPTEVAVAVPATPVIDCANPIKPRRGGFR